MMKRIIALLLALILTVGLLPTVALATEGDTPAAGTSNDVKNGYYEGTTWKEGTLNQDTLPTGVESVSKTAKKVEGEENKYEVTLKVVLKQTEENSGKAATVLVLDTSGSMAYCAECGAEPEEDCEHNYAPAPSMLSKKETYYYKYTDRNGQVRFGEAYYCNGKHTARFWLKHPAGWFTTSGDNILHDPETDSLAGQTMYVKSETPRTSRLDAAKVAAENFLKTYSGLKFNPDGTVAANQTDRNLGRYVSVVTFATGVTLQQNWIDVSNPAGYKNVLRVFTGNSLEADGGTNLDAGLTYAEYLLKQDTMKNATKNVIALTDGEPTYYLREDKRGSVRIGNKRYSVAGAGDCCGEYTKASTDDAANAIKQNDFSDLYTICFGVAADKMKKQWHDKLFGSGSWSYWDITVGQYLQSIASSKAGKQFAYTADNAAQLNTAFAAITNTIVSGLSTGTVKDSLPTGIKVSEADKQKFGTGTWELNSKAFNKTEETKQLADGTKETVYTYTKTYTVTIDPDDENLVKTEDGYAPLNGKTTLTVKNSQGTDVEIPFPIPAGKVTMPSHTVTYTDGVDSEVVFENVEKTAAYKAAIPAYGDSNPTRTGYTFTSWKWYNATDTTYANEITPAPTTMPAYNLVAVAQWTPATDTTYIVEHYLQDLTGDGYAKQETETKAGTTGATATAEAKTYTGFMFDENNASNVKSGTIAADGSLVLKLYYTRNSYKVTYDYGTAPSGASTLPTEATYKYGATVTVAAKATAPGYNFDGWKKDGNVTTSFEMPADNVTLTGTWTAKSDTAYQVKHYLQNLTDDGYTLAETETKSGTTGAQTEAVAKSYTGFTVQPFNQKTIAADGTTVVEIHYNRNTYKVTYDYGTAPAGASTLPTEATYKYGAMVTVAAKATAPGYDFDGWKKDGTVTTSFEMPAQNVTITGSWTLKAPTAVIVNLNNHIYKNFTSDTADIPNGKLTFNVTVRGTFENATSMTRSGSVEFTKQDVQNGTTSKAFTFASDPLTFTAAGEYTFEVVEDTTTTINGLTYNVGNGTHTFTIVVAKKAEVNELYVEKVSVGTTNYEGEALTAELAYATITNNYVEPKNAQVTNKEVVVTQPEGALKTAVDAFEFTSGVTVLYPTGDGTTNNTLEVPYGTDSVTLLYAITVNRGTESNTMDFDDNGATFVFAVDADVAPGSHDHFDVTFNDGISTAVIYVAKTHTPLNFVGGKCTVENVISKEVKATTTVTEKDPDKLYLDFSKYVQKELAATGSKTASDVSFRVIVNGMESPIMMYNAGEEEVSTYVEFDPRYSTVLDVNFASITGGSTETKDFTGSYVEIDQVGIYYFELNEEDGKRTGVTYDDSTYKVYVYVKREGDKLVVGSFDIYKDGLSVAGETITFHNTIDTGRDDYIPIIIPTIINKDTGMLNKTDHFAYVIGYPDGTVHPNGQITRAEVATIFFRLLKDEVRDGAFTTSNSYSDVAYGKWYSNPISTMSALGIITGYPDGTFKPNKPITRAEFAAIAARFDETQSGKSATFSDVIGHWAAKEIGIAYYNDWIKGYPDGTFKPDQNITRAEAMTLINRVLERKPESPADLLTNMNKWTDNLDTSKWYYLDVQEATNSHGYTRKTFNYELWRQMLPDPDWSRYER